MYLLLSNNFKQNVICKKEVFGSKEGFLPYFGKGHVNWIRLTNITKSYELERIFANKTELLDFLKDKELNMDGAFNSAGTSKELKAFLQSF